jgi:hypothetical protein
MDRGSSPWLDELLAEADLEYPATPDLAAAVLGAMEPPPSTPARAFPPRSLTAGAAAIAAILVALLVIPATREGIAGFLGLAVEGERIEPLPTPLPGETPTPFPTPPPLESIAEPATLTEAGDALGFEIAVPPGEGSPLVYLLRYQRQRVAILRFPTFDLWQGQVQGFVGKGILLDGTVVTETTVLSEPAYWITGGPRIVTFHNAEGTAVTGSQRAVTANTLVWATESRYYRLEGDLTLEQAVAIAATLP